MSGDVAGSAPGGLQDRCALPGFNNRGVMIVMGPLPQDLYSGTPTIILHIIHSDPIGLMHQQAPPASELIR